MGIIAALKKRYKFLYLRDVLEFYDLHESTKAKKTECIGRLRRGAVGVDFGRRAHLLDCASYVLEAWTAVSDKSIHNSFRKAEIIDFKDDPASEEDEFAFDMGSLVESIQELRDEIKSEDIDSFLHIDNEDNPEFVEVILEDVEGQLKFLNEQNSLPPNGLDNDSAHDNDSDNALDNDEALGPVPFGGFDAMFNTLLGFEEQLLCPKVQEEAGEGFQVLYERYQALSRSVRALMHSSKAKKVHSSRQATLHDMLNQSL
mgnify:FL=1